MNHRVKICKKIIGSCNIMGGFGNNSIAKVIT